jgi:hypothetical protein
MKNLFNLFRAVSLLLVALTMGIGCRGEQRNGEKDENADAPDTVKATVVNVGGELFSVPSPIQTAMLVQKGGVRYDKSSLTPTNRVNTYATDFQRALMLGIYGADLGYVSLYNQTQDALGYLAAVKQLTDKLGLSGAFDQPTMERLSKNISNKDSMMILVSVAYRAGDAYLKENARSDIGALVLAGGWVESMHFSVNAYKVSPKDEFRFRLAEQKQGLNSLIRILSKSGQTEAGELNGWLAELSRVYDEIRFTYTYAEPRTDTAKKVTYINSVTEVTVSDEQINRISSLVGKIRNGIINNRKS